MLPPQGQNPPDAFALAADILFPQKTGATVYRDDPEGFVRDCFVWGEGQGAAHYQTRNLTLLVEKKRVCVRAPHGTGKSTTAAWAVLWFALTRDAAGDDWKIVTTASAWRQLEKYLWPEIHKWVKKLNWTALGRAPFSSRELMTLSLKLRTGEAFAAACEDPAKIEGAHADQLLFIFDESKAVPAATFDAAEGAFSGGGASGGQEAYAMASSTPGAPQGRFYEIQMRKPGLEDWCPVAMKLDEVIAAGRISKDWVENRRRQWGTTSAVFINRVLGEFAESEADGVIPLAWVELAQERWHAQQEQWEKAGWHPGGEGLDGITGVRVEHSDLDENPFTLGADIARSGDDRTILALKYGWAIRKIRELPKQGTMETAGMIHLLLERHHHVARSCTGVIDVIGIGAGVVDRLRETSQDLIVPFNASERSERKDASGLLGFSNARAAAYWNLRQLLDPDSGFELALPDDDDRIVGDLTAPKWKVLSGGKILIESKDEIRKRINRSTDVGDAIVLAYWPAGGIQSMIDTFAKDPDYDFFAAAPGVSRWHHG